MDALTVLRREHTRIEQLFVEFDALPECACAGRQALMRALDEIVRRHADMKERRAVLRLLDEIAQTECHDAAYVPRVRVLREVLLHHIATSGTHAA